VTSCRRFLCAASSGYCSKIGVVIAGAYFNAIFPYFFLISNLPLVCFWVLFISALIGYFLNYQQILLVSDQKNLD
jgi:hypothetical protein